MPLPIDVLPLQVRDKEVQLLQQRQQCQYQPTDTFKDIATPYQRILDSGTLEFITREISVDNNDLTFESIEVLSFGNKFGVEVTFDPPRQDVREVVIESPQGQVRVPLFPVEGSPGLMRSPAISVLPPRRGTRLDTLLARPVAPVLRIE